MTLLGLTRDQNTRFEGEVLYKGRNVLEMSEDELEEVRGNEMSMIFQDPMTSLNPVYTVGDADLRGDPDPRARRQARGAAGGRSSC